MKGTEKQVKWARSLQKNVLDSEALLFKCFEKELMESDIVEPDEIDELLQIWSGVVRPALAEQDAAFYIDTFSNRGTDPGEVHLYILRELQDEFPDYARSDLNYCYDQLQHIEK